MITYKVHFIRHGMTQGNLEGKYIGSTDLPVCPEGYRQLDDLKAHYEYPKVEAVYSSPMLRCRQTADFLYPNAMLTVVEGSAGVEFRRLRRQDHGGAQG